MAIQKPRHRFSIGGLDGSPWLASDVGERTIITRKYLAICNPARTESDFIAKLAELLPDAFREERVSGGGDVTIHWRWGL